MKRVIFPQKEILDSEGGIVVFPAQFSGKQIRCEITYETVKKCFDPKQVLGKGSSSETTKGYPEDPSNPLTGFRIYRPFIESQAERAIINDRFEKDGTVRLTIRDFSRMHGNKPKKARP